MESEHISTSSFYNRKVNEYKTRLVSLQQLIIMTPKGVSIRAGHHKDMFSDYMRYLIKIHLQSKMFSTELAKIRDGIKSVTDIILTLVTAEQKVDPRLLRTLKKQKMDVIEKERTRLQRIRNLVMDLTNSGVPDTVRAHIGSTLNIQTLLRSKENYAEFEKIQQNMKVLEASLFGENARKRVLEMEIERLTATQEAVNKEMEALEEEIYEIEELHKNQVEKFILGISDENFAILKSEIDKKHNSNLQRNLEEYATHIQQLQREIRDVQKFLDLNNTDKSRLQKYHFIFVLDESDSIIHFWNDIIGCFNDFINTRLSMTPQDLVSIILFDDKARTIQKITPIQNPIKIPPPRGGGTNFNVAFKEISEVLEATPDDSFPVILFLTDGSGTYTATNNYLFSMRNMYFNLVFFAIAFGIHSDIKALQIMSITANGSLVLDAGNQEYDFVSNAPDIKQLRDVFNTLVVLVDPNTVCMFGAIKILTTQITVERRLFEEKATAIKAAHDSDHEHLNRLRISTGIQKNTGIPQPAPQIRGSPVAEKRHIWEPNPTMRSLPNFRIKTKPKQDVCSQWEGNITEKPLKSQKILRRVATQINSNFQEVLLESKTYKPLNVVKLRKRAVLKQLKEYTEQSTNVLVRISKLQEQIKDIKRTNELKKQQMVDLHMAKQSENAIIALSDFMDMTGFHNEEELIKFSELFGSSDYFLATLLDIISITEQFLSQASSQINEMSSSLSGNRDYLKSMADVVGSIIETFSLKYPSVNISPDCPVEALQIICQQYDPTDYKEVKDMFEIVNLNSSELESLLTTSFEDISYFIEDRDLKIFVQKDTMVLEDKLAELNDQISEKESYMCYTTLDEQGEIQTQIDELKECQIQLQAELDAQEVYNQGIDCVLVTYLQLLHHSLSNVLGAILNPLQKKVVEISWNGFNTNFIPNLLDFSNFVDKLALTNINKFL